MMINMNATTTGLVSTTPAVADDSSTDVCSSPTDLTCVTVRLWQIITPAIIVLGLTGNIMVLIVFGRLHFTKSSTLIHMFMLSVTDSVIMLVGPLRYWIINVFDYDIRMVSSAGCKLGLFVLYLTLDFSAWILVSVSVERALGVLKPLHTRTWFTVRRTLWRLVVIFVFLCLLNGHYFFSNGIVTKTQTLSDISHNNSTLSRQNNFSLFSKINSSFFSESNSSFSSENKTVIFSESSSVFLSTNSSFNSNSSLYTAGATLSATTSCLDCINTVSAVPTGDTNAILVTYDCDSLTAEWEYFEEMRFVYIDLCFDSLIPFVIMLICNVFIIVALRRKSQNRPRHTTRRQLAKVQATKSNSDPLSRKGNTAGGSGQSGTQSSVRSFSLTNRRDHLRPTSFPLPRRHNMPSNPRSLSLHNLGDSLSYAAYDNPLFRDCTNSEKHAEPEAGSSHSADGTANENNSNTISTEQDINATVSDVNVQEMDSQKQGVNSKSGAKRTVSESNSMPQDVGRRRVSKTRGKFSVSNAATTQGNPSTYSKYSFTKRKVTPPVSTHPAPAEQSKNDVRTDTNTHPQVRETSKPHPSSNASSRRSKDITTQSYGVTRILLLVTTVFFITTLPSAIYFIVDSYLREVGVEGESRTNRILDLVQAVTNLLQYSNYGCNFLLYSSRSRRFRMEVKYMLGIIDSRFRRHFKSSVLSKGTTVRDTNRTSTLTTGSRQSTPHVHSPPSTSLNGHVPKGPLHTQTEDNAISKNEHVPISEPEAGLLSITGNRNSSANSSANGIDPLSVAELSSLETVAENMEMSHLSSRHVPSPVESIQARRATSAQSTSPSRHSGLTVHLETELADTVFSTTDSTHVVDEYEDNQQPSNNRDEADILFDNQELSAIPSVTEYNQKRDEKDMSSKLLTAKSCGRLTKKKRKLGRRRLPSSSVEKLCPNCETWRHFAMTKETNENDLIPVGEMVYEDRQRFCVRF